ncbi:hypothetical protein NKI96_10550 [Mesorhizobium sp. M0292]|uniref:hypothetical protein n=1 Tax=Mesorhizobium sp. M0292 TaxID=2956929 RepID=UPI003339D429
MSTKYRTCPDDDYTIDPGMTLADALRNALDVEHPQAQAVALRLMVGRLAEAGILTEDDVLTILNSGLGWGPTRAGYRWEVVPPTQDKDLLV